MSATRGRERTPERAMTSRPATMSRRTSPSAPVARAATARRAIRAAAPFGSTFWRAAVAFSTSRILFCRGRPRPEEAPMAWDFETDPEFQAKLDWADAFVREEVEPLDMVWPDLVFTPPDDNRRKVID